MPTLETEVRGSLDDVDSEIEQQTNPLRRRGGRTGQEEG
jgi:hypothetical protein